MNSYKTDCDNIFNYSITRKMDEYQELANAFSVIIADYEALMAKRTISEESDEDVVQKKNSDYLPLNY